MFYIYFDIPIYSCAHRTLYRVNSGIIIVKTMFLHHCVNMCCVFSALEHSLTCPWKEQNLLFVGILPYKFILL